MTDEPQKLTADEVLVEPVTDAPSDKTEEYLNNWKRERADFLNKV